MVDHSFAYRDLPDEYDYDEMSDEELTQRLDYGRRFMEEVDGAVGLLNSRASNGNLSGMKMAAFLSIFHPNMDEERKRELIMDARHKDERDRQRGYS